MPTPTTSAVHRSPLHHWHVAHGARIAESDGWCIPLSYADARQEAEAARNGVGLADISAFAKLSLRGPGVSGVAAGRGNLGLRRVSTIDGGIACRLSEQCLILLASSTIKSGLAEDLQSAAEIVRTDITSAYAGFLVIGQNIEALFRGLTAFDVSIAAFANGACAETEMAGLQALLARPPTRSIPEIAVYVAWDVGEYFWEHLLHTGGALGVAPVGQDCLRLLRPVS